MILIDCREGLSGDMLLSALLQLLPENTQGLVVSRMKEAAKSSGLAVTVMDVAESGDVGKGISYSRSGTTSEETTYQEAFDELDRFSEALTSTSDLPRRILGSIFDAEAEAHGLPAEQVHLHEIGRPEAVLNMAAVGLIHSELELVGEREYNATTIVTGKGIIVVSHGAMRVPAPVSRILLRGLRHTTGDDPGERATPTGIACVKALVSEQSDNMPETFHPKGIGFGTKRFGGRLGRTTAYWV